MRESINQSHSSRRAALLAMAGLGRSGFLAIAVIFHLIYIYSIFDIYFVSPIVSGMRAFSVDAPEAPAKRLVLFVGKRLLRPTQRVKLSHML